MSIQDMPEGMKSEFLAAFRAEFGFGEMTATANDDAATMLKAAAWAWKASRAVVIVQLPNTECFGKYSEEAARIMRDGCAEAILEQGLNYEVSP